MRYASLWLLTVMHPDEHAQRRGQMTILVACGLLITALSFLGLVLSFAAQRQAGLMSLGAGTAVFLVTIWLTRRGWVDLGAWLMIGACLIGILAPIFATNIIGITPFFLVFAIVTGGLVLKPWEIWVVLGLILVGLAAVVVVLPRAVVQQSGEQLALLGSTIMLVTVTLISFLAAYRIDASLTSLNQARRLAHDAAIALTQANTDLETRVTARTHELRTALAEVEMRATTQAHLLAENEQQRITIREMLVPVLPINDTTLVIPLVGTLDSVRLHDLQQYALEALERTHAQRILLDLTGVAIVDTLVAQRLLQVAQSAQLLGAKVVLIGIRPEVAQTIVALGIDVGYLQTFQNLQAALTTRDVSGLSPTRG